MYWYDRWCLASTSTNRANPSGPMAWCRATPMTTPAPARTAHRPRAWLQNPRRAQRRREWRAGARCRAGRDPGFDRAPSALCRRAWLAWWNTTPCTPLASAGAAVLLTCWRRIDRGAGRTTSPCAARGSSHFTAALVQRLRLLGMVRRKSPLMQRRTRSGGHRRHRAARRRGRRAGRARGRDRCEPRYACCVTVWIRCGSTWPFEATQIAQATPARASATRLPAPLRRRVRRDGQRAAACKSTASMRALMPARRGAGEIRRHRLVLGTVAEASIRRPPGTPRPLVPSGNGFVSPPAPRSVVIAWRRAGHFRGAGGPHGAEAAGHDRGVSADARRGASELSRDRRSSLIDSWGHARRGTLARLQGRTRAAPRPTPPGACGKARGCSAPIRGHRRDRRYDASGRIAIDGTRAGVSTPTPFRHWCMGAMAMVSTCPPRSVPVRCAPGTARARASCVGTTV